MNEWNKQGSLNRSCRQAVCLDSTVHNNTYLLIHIVRTEQTTTYDGVCWLLLLGFGLNAFYLIYELLYIYMFSCRSAFLVLHWNFIIRSHDDSRSRRNRAPTFRCLEGVIKTGLEWSGIPWKNTSMHVVLLSSSSYGRSDRGRHSGDWASWNGMI